MKVKKNRKKIQNAFGLIEAFDLIDFPTKMSGTQITRLLIGDFMGCSFCFPHGLEVSNSKNRNRQKNWKSYRKTQWK